MGEAGGNAWFLRSRLTLRDDGVTNGMEMGEFWFKGQLGNG